MFAKECAHKLRVRIAVQSGAVTLDVVQQRLIESEGDATDYPSAGGVVVAIRSWILHGPFLQETS